MPKDYPTSGFRHPVSNAYKLDTATKKWLDENTTAWASRLIAMPRAIKGSESMRVRMIGMSDKDQTVFKRTMWNIEGHFPSNSNEILVAKTPAKLLGLELG